MKAALLITYTFPPFKNNSHRTYFIFQELKRYFKKIDVITTSNRIPFLDNAKDELTAKNIHAATTIDYRSIRNKKNGSNNYLHESGKTFWKWFFYKLINSFPFNLFLGEGGIIYIFSAVRLGKQILNKQPDALIISSFRPYADHFIAYCLKKKFPSTTWVADFRDLHLDPMLNEVFLSQFQNWCNKKILSKADLVTTVSAGLAEHLRPIHSNISVLRNGIGAMENDTAFLPSATKFTITYTGSMFRDLRRPDWMLKALSELIDTGKIDQRQIEIRYAGKDTGVWINKLKKEKLYGIFQSLGTVPREQAIALQKTSHINLLLTYSSHELKGNATGKLYEYFQARRPILLLIHGGSDKELESMMEKTNAGLVAYETEEGLSDIKSFILEKYEGWKATGLVLSPITNESLAPYRWENMIKEFLNHPIFQKKTTPIEV